jgi:hypothetical protein
LRERTAEEKQSLHEEQSLQGATKEPARLDVAVEGRTAGTQVGQEKAVNRRPARETKQSVSCSPAVSLALAGRLGS